MVVNLKVGDIVTVTGGAWAGSVKAIQSVNVEADRQLLLMSICSARETPVEISFSEVKKM